MIVIVFGLPGSGKSYFAERLAKQLEGEYVNSDRLRKELFATPSYSEEEKAAVYSIMLEQMKKAINQKRNIVLDATFHQEKSRRPFIEEAGKESIVFIEVKTAEAITRERLKRTRPYSDADFEVYRLLQPHWEPISGEHLVLESTNENIEHMLQKAAVHLQPNHDKRTD